MRTILTIVYLLTLAPIPVAAEGPPCAPLDKMIWGIGARWGERPAIQGDIDQTSKMLLLTNSESHTWTVLSIHGDTACAIMGGNNLDVVKTPVGDPS